MGTDLERRRRTEVEPSERLVSLISANPSGRKAYPRIGYAAAASIAMVAIFIAAIGLIAPRLLPVPAALAQPSQMSSALASNPAKSADSLAGCAISAAVITASDSEQPVVGFGSGEKPPLTGLAIEASDPRAAFVHPLAESTSPSGLRLQASLLSPWTAAGATTDTKLLLVYSRLAVAGLNITQIVAGGGWIVAEAPAAGQTATAIEGVLDGMGATDHYAQVVIGPYPGVIVHGDAAPWRPYTLSWSDGTRDMSVLAIAPANQVIDYARSFYCS